MGAENFIQYNTNGGGGLTAAQVQAMIDAAIQAGGSIPFVAIDPPFALDNSMWVNTTTKEFKIKFADETVVLDIDEGQQVSLFGTPLGDI